MLKRFVSATAKAVLLSVLLTLPVLAQQGFELLNTTGVEIHAVFVGPNDSDDWGENLLDEDEILPHGEAVEIEFDPDEDIESWDIRVEDSEGNALEFTAIPLLEAESVNLKDDNTATIE